MNKHEHKNVESESENEHSKCSCECGDECNGSEDISLKDIAYHADDKVDALIHLLIKKNIISESEFEEEYNNLFEEGDDEEAEEKEA
jgi:hypothetical protein